MTTVSSTMTIEHQSELVSELLDYEQTSIAEDEVDFQKQEVQIPYGYARKHEVLVDGVDPDGRWRVIALEQPQLLVLSELRRRLRGPSKVMIVDREDFDIRLRSIYDKGDSEANQVMDDLDGEIDLERLAHELPETTDLLEASDDAPVIRLINALLTQAIREGVSDIHVEAFEKESVVRFRRDGILRDVLRPRRALHGALVSRLKIMSRLDIAEKRLPQDGRMSLSVAEHPVDVRVSTLPTQHGERVVLRLLDNKSGPISETVALKGWPALPNKSQNTTGDGCARKSCILIKSIRSSILWCGFAGFPRPLKSPFTSAKRTGTPSFENPSARTCREIVFPVPVAPAIMPWRLAILAGIMICLSPFPPSKIEAMSVIKGSQLLC